MQGTPSANNCKSPSSRLLGLPLLAVQRPQSLREKVLDADDYKVRCVDVDEQLGLRYAICIIPMYVFT